MKQLFIILFLLPFIALSQTYIGQNKGVTLNRGAFRSDSVFTLPVRDTVFPVWLGSIYKTGSVTMKGTVPYYYNGTKWSMFSTTFDSSYIYQALDDTAAAIRGDFPVSADSSIFATNYMLDTTRDNLESRLLSSSTTSQQDGYFYKAHLYNMTSTRYLELRNDGTSATAHRSLGINIGDADKTLIMTGSATLTGTNTGDDATNTTSNTYADGKVADAIHDGTTTIAPAQNAVFDALALKAPLASPTFTGTVTVPTPWTLGATSVTTTGTQLNYLNAANGTTGTTSTKVVFSTSPTLTTPILGAATATSLNTGTTLNGVIFAKSTTDIDLSSTVHALTVGGESNSTNLAIGEYSTGVGLQARNNGAIGALHLNPLSGDVRIGTTYAGLQNFTINNTDAGTGSYIEMGLRNGAASADGLLLRTLGTGFTTSGANFQDGGAILTSTNLSGGLSLGTQASADLRVYTNNTLRTTWAAATGNISTTGQVLSSGGAIGYTTGAGGTVTQATSKSTGCTINELSGEITMNGAALAAGTIVSFTFTNSTLTATDVLVLNHVTTGTRGAYTLNAQCAAGSAVIYVRNNTAGSLSEAIVIRYATIKGSTN